jgi:hypothetical protein
MMNRQTFLAVLALLSLTAFIGLTKVAYPLMDDQTLFLLGGQMIGDGAVPYRDFWDLKPPGIFLLYWLGGSLFGFNDVGIHLFELALLVGFALLAFLYLRDAIGPRAAWLGGFLTVLFYYLMNDVWSLANTEGLACLPAGMALFGLLAARSKRQLILAGVSAGFLVLLKPFYGLIVLAFWLVFLALDSRHSRQFATWLILLGSAAGAVAPVVLWFAIRGALSEFLEAVLVVPYEARSMVEPLKRLYVLRLGLWDFGTGAAPLLLLSVPAAWSAWKHRHNRRLMLCVASLGAWIVSGAVAILLQVQSWWNFHWFLVLPPVALLAGYGLDTVLRQFTRPWSWRVAAMLVLFGVVLSGKRVAGEGRDIVVTLPDRVSALDPDKTEGYQLKTFDRLRSWRRDAEYVNRPSGTVLAWMSPIIYRFSRCRRASAVLGTNMSVLPPRVLRRVRAELQASRPQYIYLLDEDIPGFAASLPGVLEHYTCEYRGQYGAWYRRTSC